MVWSWEDLDIAPPTRCIFITLPVIVSGLLDEAWYDMLVRDYFAVIAARGYMVEINTKSYHEPGYILSE